MAGLNEFTFGAEHSSGSGFNRLFTGKVLWAAALAPNFAMTDGTAAALYASDFPYNLMKPKRGYPYWWNHVSAGTTVVPWPLWQRRAA
jgi:hypothetical protein